MSSQLPGHGEDWTKRFRKVTVAGGPLKGARYSEVSVEDLERSARSYRADPRFNQYAKRMVTQTQHPMPRKMRVNLRADAAAGAEHVSGVAGYC